MNQSYRLSMSGEETRGPERRWEYFTTFTRSVPFCFIGVITCKEKHQFVLIRNIFHPRAVYSHTPVPLVVINFRWL